MRVLSVTSEIHPLIKTGGLADVAGALPLALGGMGVECRSIIPGYPLVMDKVGKAKPVESWPDLFGGAARLFSLQQSGLDLLVLDAPHLYARKGGPYADSSGKDWPDNWRRFAALARAAADVAAGKLAGWKPDLVHAHDWQAALTPAYLAYGPAAGVPSVMTVHNLAFQGQFPASIFPELGLAENAWSVDGVEYYGGVGYLKAGLQLASAITTVSPTYAQEIRSAEFGMGLDGLINARSVVVHGIVNGIDMDEWNPETDSRLAQIYNARKLAARKPNRKAMETRFQLESDASPIFCVISRLTWQKGMDVLAAAVDGIVASGARLVVLGSGDNALEGELLGAAARHRGRVGAIIGYDEGLSHLIQGGADAIVIPSRFEPCGLTQLYGLRYGCIPVVTRTGGLADTVIDANDAAVNAGVATGIQFSRLDVPGLLNAIHRTQSLFADRKTWSAMQKAAMKSDVSWGRSAARYHSLYSGLTGQ